MLAWMREVDTRMIPCPLEAGRPDTRVLICDRHRLFRQALRHLLSREDDLRVVGEAATARQALWFSLWYQPHVVLIDVDLPDIDGLVVTRHLTSLVPAPRVVILTTCLDHGVLADAVRAGAAAYVLKRADRAHLIETVRHVATTPTRFCLKDMHSLLDQASMHGEALLPEIHEPRLSDAQRHLLQLLTRGASNRDIARSLGVKEKTVRNRLTELFSLLGVRSRMEAALYAARTGIAKNASPTGEP